VTILGSILSSFFLVEKKKKRITRLELSMFKFI